PWQTQAAILAKAGVQLGDVASHTNTSPGSTRCRSSAECRTRARPRASPADAATPVRVVTSWPADLIALKKWVPRSGTCHQPQSSVVPVLIQEVGSGCGR